MAKQAQQVPTRKMSLATIMRNSEFARGVAEVRAGKAPDFSTDSWAYERGRQFALLAPRSMPLRIDGKLNRKALALFDVALGRRYII